MRASSILGILVVALGFGNAHSAAASDNRPNILFCLADDWSWPHAGIYGDKVIQVPTFDRLAREGILFTHAFSAAPTCSASRASILTGQAPHRLEAAANLYGPLDKKFAVYPDQLEAAGYVVGKFGKGWGPGNVRACGRTRNPAGPDFKSFDEFLKTVPAGKPFCFWFGSHDPHRPYVAGTGVKAGMKPDEVQVPPYFPDSPEVRKDILDYYAAAERFDRDTGNMLALLAKTGQLSNTLVVVTGDNGWPFPRCKANLYDGGTRQPFAAWWPAKIKAGQTSDAFISLTDLAPTFMEVAGLISLPEMTGRSLLGLFEGQSQPNRDVVFVERERHANVRQGNLGYPSRAVETPDYLYIENLRPDRWPGGDPERWKSVGPFGDCDAGFTKDYILAHRSGKFFQMAFGKRPAEEFYDLHADPDQLHDLAENPEYAAAKKKMAGMLDNWRAETGDPLLKGREDPFDAYPYRGPQD